VLGSTTTLGDETPLERRVIRARRARCGDRTILEKDGLGTTFEGDWTPHEMSVALVSAIDVGGRDEHRARIKVCLDAWDETRRAFSSRLALVDGLTPSLPRALYLAKVRPASIDAAVHRREVFRAAASRSHGACTLSRFNHSRHPHFARCRPRRRKARPVAPAQIQVCSEIDHHLGCAMSGLTADTRTMVDHKRVTAQNHAFVYDERIKVESVMQAVRSRSAVRRG
jgi:hypothetical protein